MISRTTLAIILAVMCAANGAAQSRPIPLSGTWSFTVKSGNTIGTPTVTFNQRDETLTGHYSSMTFGDADLKGSVRKESVTFTVFATYGGERQDLIFTGTYDGRRAITGTYSNSFGNGTFEATRK